MKTTIAGEHVEVLAQRALSWPRAATFLVADAHFRSSGFAVPAGTTRADERVYSCGDRAVVAWNASARR